MGTAGEGGVGCVAAPSNGHSLLPSFLRVTLGRGLETPLQPAPLPDPGSTFQALGGSGLPKACRALANFSPGHAGSRPGLWRHRSVCCLTLSIWRERRAGSCAHPALCLPR